MFVQACEPNNLNIIDFVLIDDIRNFLKNFRSDT